MEYYTVKASQTGTMTGVREAGKRGQIHKQEQCLVESSGGEEGRELLV
jgi:hypothetical protein